MSLKSSERIRLWNCRRKPRRGELQAAHETPQIGRAGTHFPHSGVRCSRRGLEQLAQNPEETNYKGKYGSSHKFASGPTRAGQADEHTVHVRAGGGFRPAKQCRRIFTQWELFYLNIHERDDDDDHHNHHDIRVNPCLRACANCERSCIMPLRSTVTCKTQRHSSMTLIITEATSHCGGISVNERFSQKRTTIPSDELRLVIPHQRESSHFERLRRLILVTWNQ